MAISTYAELKTAVANWLDRDDLTDRIPEFIALAEARMNRVLRLRMMESKYTASTVAGQRNYALPTGYIQMRNFQLNTSPITSLSYVSPEIYDRLWGGSQGGTPSFYTIITNELQLGPIPGSVMTLEMLFYKKTSALSVSNTTEQMLTDNPDIYLYGALLEAEPFIMNDERIQVWAQGFEKAVVDLQEQDNKDRHSGSALRVMNTGGYM
jgi:hypothetical protein|tara:strand:+ start:1105 stop:1731 length:627 start_codon:yes stop_codon:yes gene_type:complete